jgi:hypothetical protein
MKSDPLESQGDPVGRDPSYPDRARIDSDVRAFLRPASSPWIVFDRDSRVDDFGRAALRVGAAFASSPNLQANLQEGYVENDGVVTSAPLEIPPIHGGIHGGGRLSHPFVAQPAEAKPMFPETSGAPDVVVEPSNVVVATDVEPPPAPRTVAPSLVVLPPGLVRSKKRVAWTIGACLGLALLVGAGTVAVRSHRHVSAAHAPPTHAPPASPPPPVEQPVVAADKPEVAPPPPAASVAEPAGPAATAPVATADTEGKKKPLLGKFTIKNDGKVKNVWFDGKRMLGTGTRSFLVACGMHTVAVNDRGENKDIEIPCNGEFVVSK